MKPAVTGRSVMQRVDSNSKNPFLFTSNGVGARFYGRRDYDPGTRSYVTTHWLTFIFIPLFPLGAYRVSGAGSGSCEILGRVPLADPLRSVRCAIASMLVSLLAARFSFQRPKPLPLAARAPTNQATPTTPYNAAHAAISKDEIALSSLVQSLENRRRKLRLEGADLDRQKRYLAGVAWSYAKEAVPQGGQALLDALVTDYNSRRKEYERKRAALKTEMNQ